MPGHAPPPTRPARSTESQSITSVPMGPRRVPSTLHHPSDSQSFSVASSSMAASVSSDDSTFVTCSETSHRADTQMDHRREDLSRGGGHGTAQSSLPNSSQPSSSDQSTSMPPPPVPRRAAHESADVMSREQRTVNAGDGRSQVLTSLSKHPSLYDMSRAELEVFIGQVIREEGFLQLVTRKSSR